MRRRDARVDENQPDMVRVARQEGATVQPLHAVGEGCPDLLLGICGFNFLVEIKNPRQVPSKRRLTKDQTTWWKRWGGQVVSMETEDEMRQFIRRVQRGYPEQYPCGVTWPSYMADRAGSGA